MGTPWIIPSDGGATPGAPNRMMPSPSVLGVVQGNGSQSGVAIPRPQAAEWRFSRMILG